MFLSATDQTHPMIGSRRRFFLRSSLLIVSLFAVQVLASVSAEAQDVPRFLKIGQQIDLDRSITIVQLAPPMLPRPYQGTLRQLVGKRPSVLLFVDLSRPQVRDEVSRFARLNFKNLKPILIAYAKTKEGLGQAIKVLQDIPFGHPVILDSSGYFAFALAAFRPPQYSVLDAGGRLMINKIHSLNAPIKNGTTFKDVLRDIDHGKPIPRSDGERILDISTLVGKPVPDFTVTKADIGKAPSQKYTRADLKKSGKPALIVFWMATCPHCQREIPRIWRWYKAHEKEVKLITITNLARKSVVEYAVKYLTKENLQDLPIYQATDAEYKNFRVQGIPAWAFVAPGAGKVLEARTGEQPDLEKFLDRALARSH